MTLQYASDLHLEFNSNPPIIPSSDTLFLAGDIGNPFYPKYQTFLENLSPKFKDIFLIAGNHEYYNHGHTIQETNTKISSIVEKLSNIHFLNNSTYQWNDLKIIGTTLWTLGDLTQKKYMNDFRLIQDFKNNPDNYNLEYQKSVDFLKNEITSPCIVLSHHLPSYQLISERYKHLAMNCFFASNLDELIKEPVKLWICGHTHTNIDKRVNSIRVVVNPHGYHNENPEYQFDAVINL